MNQFDDSFDDSDPFDGLGSQEAPEPRPALVAWSNTAQATDGEPTDDGQGMVCWTSGPYKSHRIYRVPVADALVDETELLDLGDDDEGYVILAIECESAQLATTLCTALNARLIPGLA